MITQELFSIIMLLRHLPPYLSYIQWNCTLLRGYLQSLGVELNFDIRTLRLFDLDMGIRFSNTLETNDYSPKFEIIITSVNF